MRATSERVRVVVEEVLDRPEYAPLSPSLWERMFDSVLELLGRLLSSVIGVQGGALVASVLLAVAAGGAAVLTLRLLRGLRRDPEREAAVTSPIGRPAVDWRAEAGDHERAGRWRQALRCRYRALIAELAADGVVEEVPGRTTGEYLAAVCSARPTSAQAMAEVTAAFEAAWYGEAPVDADAVAALDERAARISR